MSRPHLGIVKRGENRTPGIAVPLGARAVVVMFSVMLVCQALLSIPHGAFTAHAQTEPPASGDWIISDITVKTNVVIEMKGNVTVKLNGKLTLERVMLVFNSTANNEYKFIVETGGQLIIRNSTVTPKSTSWRYTVDLRGKTEIFNSSFYDGGVFLDPNIIKVQYSDVVISKSNFLRANGSAIFIYPGNSPNVKNNSIRGGEFGLFLMDNIAGIPNCSPMLANNTIVDTKNTAIYLGEKTSPKVIGNIILNPGNRGIHIQYTNAFISYNYIANSTTEAGIFLYGNTIKPSPRIQNNTIVDSLIGFTVSGPARGSFEDNTVYRSTTRGVVYQWGPETSMLRNDILSSKYDGLFMMHDANPLVKGNTFYNNDCNIRLDSRALGNFVNNTIRGGSYGIHSSQSSPDIDGNKLYEQSKVAIAMTDTYYGYESSITNNVIMNTDTGMTIAQADPVIQFNRIKYTNTTAIRIDAGSAPVLVNNTISFNDRTGIEVKPSATPAIYENGFDHNLYGLVLNGAQMQVDANRFESNDFAVICDGGTTSLFHNNSFTSSTFFDFLVKGGSHPTVSSTYIDKSHVAADQTSSLKVQWNVALRVLNTKNMPEVGATVAVYNKSMMVVSDKTKTNGLLAPFTAVEAEVTYDGIKSFGPFRVEVQHGDLRNVTVMDIMSDLDITIYLDYPPMLSLTSIDVDEDKPKTIDLSQYLSDPDGDKADIMISCNSPHVEIDNVNKDITVSYWGGESYDILLLNLTDGIRSTMQQVIVNVNLTNDPPRLQGQISDFEVMEDLGWTLNLSQYFTDEEYPEGLTFVASVPDITIDNTTKFASWNAEGGGMLTDIYIRCYDAFDGLYIDSNKFTLFVIQVNDPPVFLGGLKNEEVKEDTIWRINLMRHFSDEEDTQGLTFTSNDPRVTISPTADPDVVWATWTPGDGATSIIGLTFTAHDALDKNLTTISSPITLTYLPVDSPPEFISSCLDNYPKVVYGPNAVWSLIVSDCFYDEENDKLIYSSNRPNSINLTSDRHGRVWATYLAPKDATTDQVIQGLIFYAQQDSGDARIEKARTYPINFTYKVNITTTPEPKVIFVSARIAPFVYGAIPLGIIGTASAFYIYRRVKFHKYAINDIFLIFNDGRLVTHVTGSGGASKLDKDILASMLTAIQEFVKDSFSGREISSLQEMRYGEQNIIIERGIFAYLSTVVKGNVTEKLKDDMKDALRNIERKYANILESWDGDNKKLAQIDDELKKLVKKQPKNLLDLLRSY